LLEIEYEREEGTGLGPTLEFYTIISRMLKEDKTLWRINVKDDCLFPKPIASDTDPKLVCDKFLMAGIFVAKSISDNRMIDLPFSELMWDLLLGKKKNLFDL
jgi:E3 ubiquitin-protein ligase TRIP12